MSKYKDADLLKAVLVMSDKTGKMKCGDMRKVLELVDNVPTADVRENVKGKWQPIEVQPYFKNILIQVQRVLFVIEKVISDGISAQIVVQI